MREFKKNTIIKKEFIKLNEKDVMFITNPGRMGDEDGSTFIIKQGNEYIVYRIDGWLYGKKELSKDEFISLDDVSKQFPKWREAWKNGDNEKYKYLYMGFGNGLSIDNSVYNKFEPYLNKLVDKYLENYKDKKKESLKYAAVYNCWEDAFMEMVKEKNIELNNKK